MRKCFGARGPSATEGKIALAFGDTRKKAAIEWFKRHNGKACATWPCSVDEQGYVHYHEGRANHLRETILQLGEDV